MKDFLDYFSARKYETNKGYSTEWVVKKIRWSNEKEAIGILKVGSQFKSRGVYKRKVERVK